MSTRAEQDPVAAARARIVAQALRVLALEAQVRDLKHKRQGIPARIDSVAILILQRAQAYSRNE